MLSDVFIHYLLKPLSDYSLHLTNKIELTTLRYKFQGAVQCNFLT